MCLTIGFPIVRLIIFFIFQNYIPSGVFVLNDDGGCSTDPKTAAGKMAVGEATRQRMASGQGDKAKAGFQVWLDGGGRELLSRMAKMRARRKRWLKEQAQNSGQLCRK